MRTRYVHVQLCIWIIVLYYRHSCRRLVAVSSNSAIQPWNKKQEFAVRIQLFGLLQLAYLVTTVI
jgi:hypothetical protein